MTPTSADDLPPLGELVADDAFWPGKAWRTCGVWLTAATEPGHLAVVTETILAAPVTESAGHIWVALARRYGSSSIVLLEHKPVPEAGEGMETLDLVRIGADGSPHWSRIWQTPRKIPVTPSWNSGWLPTGTESSASRRVTSTGVRATTTDRRTVTPPPGSGAWTASHS